MEKVGAYSFSVEPYLSDFRGRATLPMLGNYLIHAASEHAAGRGFGFTDMSENNTAWVLSRLAIEIKEYPMAGDSIIVYTWINEVGRLFTHRCFEIADASGKVYGYARSIWAAIDVNTRKPTALDIDALSVYLSDRPCPIEKPGKILPAESEELSVNYKVKYSDLDINGHLNSIKYIEHLLDLFDKVKFEKQNVSRFEIAYQAEGRYGMDLLLYKKEMANQSQYCMAIANDEKVICRAMAKWE